MSEMKVINSGNSYEIYGNDLRTYDNLPAATYKVSFNPMTGFSLVKVSDFETLEEKIYGNHMEKIEKVLRSYQNMNRSLGVILSGDKGMERSLFVQLLAQEAISKGIPVIMVTKAFPGVADFIESIKQEVLVIFDEFEKIFPIRGEGGESQQSMLSLFDGLSQCKRLYAITVNDLRGLSEFIISRTGRFHYHLRFDYPTAEEVEIYLQDKLEEQYYGQIPQVVNFCNRVKLNYDSLRAIAFEINQGYPFNVAIADLNILTTEAQRYDVKVTLTNGDVATAKGCHFNLFSPKCHFDTYCKSLDDFSMNFDPGQLKTISGGMFLSGEHVELRHYLTQEELKKEGIEDIGVESIVLSHHVAPSLNYQLF